MSRYIRRDNIVINESVRSFELAIIKFIHSQPGHLDVPNVLWLPNEISNKVSMNVFLSLDFFLHAFMPDHLELLSFSCHLPQFPVVFRTSSTITITAIGWIRPPLDNDNNKHNNKKWRVRELEDRIFCPNFQLGFFPVDYLSKQKFMTKPTKKHLSVSQKDLA